MKAVIVSFFGKLIQKWRLMMPGKKTHDVWKRERKVDRIREYYYTKYAISALRVIAWIILVLGFIGSLVWGITMGGFEGGFLIVIGMIGSFLAWLLLLAARELLKLFMDLKENTINTAEGVAKKSR